MSVRDTIIRMTAEYDERHVKRLKARLMDPKIIPGQKEEIWREAAQLGVSQALRDSFQPNHPY